MERNACRNFSFRVCSMDPLSPADLDPEISSRESQPSRLSGEIKRKK